MEHVPVVSRHLTSVGYDTAHQWLEIAFRNGALYRYYGVPEVIYRQLISALSPGAYFNVCIKRGQFPYAVIKEPT